MKTGLFIVFLSTCIVRSVVDGWLLTSWNCFAIIYERLSSVPAPMFLQCLTNGGYRKKIILIASCTSTPGLRFVVWAVGVFRDSYLDYWQKLKLNILIMAPSRSTGYGLCISGFSTGPAGAVSHPVDVLGEPPCGTSLLLPDNSPGRRCSGSEQWNAGNGCGRETGLLAQ